MYYITQRSERIVRGNRHPIIIVLQGPGYNGKRVKRKITLDPLYACTAEEWDNEKAMYTKKLTGHRMFNTKLQDLRDKLDIIYSTVKSKYSSPTPDDFKKEYVLDISAGNVLMTSQAIEDMIESKLKARHPATAMSYTRSLEKWRKYLHQYHNGVDIALSNLNLRILNELTSFILDTATRGKGGLKNTMEDLRACYNLAVDYELIPYPKDGKTPFIKYDFKRTQADEPNKKQPLSREQWEVLKAYEPKNPAQDFCKDLFIFMVHCYGINLKDLMFITRDSIASGTDEDGASIEMVRYLRSKTNSHKKEKIDVVIDSVMRDIIDKYSKNSKYLMPIMGRMLGNHRRGTSEFQKSYSAMICGINSRLIHIAKAAGIDNRITLYTSRHTFATLLFTGGADLATISTALGHSTMVQTQSYLSKLDPLKVHKRIQGKL